MTVSRTQQAIGPSRPSESNIAQAKKADTTKISGKMGGRSIGQSLKGDFSRIKTLTKNVFKQITSSSDNKTKLSSKKPFVMKGSENRQLQKLNTLRANKLLKKTDQFVKNDQSSMISTVKNRKAGVAIGAEIEKKRNSDQSMERTINTLRQNGSRRNSSEAELKAAALEIEQNRANAYKSALPVQEAMKNAHTVIDSAKELKGMQQLAKKNPGAVSLSDQKLINQRLKEIQPLAKQAKEALASPNYRNLFERLFIP